MKEQRETNNASPAVPVNLQMWPSAPREKEKGKETGRREGGAVQRERGKKPPSGSTKLSPRRHSTNDLAPLHTANCTHIGKSSRRAEGPLSAVPLTRASDPHTWPHALLSPRQKYNSDVSFLSLPLQDAGPPPLSPYFRQHEHHQAASWTTHFIPCPFLSLFFFLTRLHGPILHC